MCSVIKSRLTLCKDCCAPSASLTASWSLVKPASIELVMLSNHLILWDPLLLLPSTFPSIGVFSSESALWPGYCKTVVPVCKPHGPAPPQWSCLPPGATCSLHPGGKCFNSYSVHLLVLLFWKYRRWAQLSIVSSLLLKRGTIHCALRGPKGGAFPPSILTTPAPLLGCLLGRARERAFGFGFKMTPIAPVPRERLSS